VSDLGKKDATAITVDDNTAITKAFQRDRAQRDGIVIPASTDDTELQSHRGCDHLASAPSSIRSGQAGHRSGPRRTKRVRGVDAYAAWLVGRGDAIAVLVTAPPPRPPRSPRAREGRRLLHGAGSLRSPRGAAAFSGPEPLWRPSESIAQRR